ncbi:MAG: hypothetical protein A2W90_08405 [Bacteroidetes bacterium GWF2_42_66]|nr:MAG: hypothetical protein A2W92_15025 [Bacteroidetes bacterium GWA2_42_15]OFX96494.1 MAG: hypothetical protein A2W89_06065 [Bacteroidetes bacterium GWE2_42_39]OFY40914.1 MAG: hypothetical protein A2W90_08405 [Bacteroidetes bacterium GWF2_42_66]HBL76346.1 hypothetical protein [Prolixibacteraceae bacterium]HCR92100.1 hypothetical protein [Prolixibacteraceae bacterium]
MISGTFKYSVLQYIPSQVLNERVNIGIIVFFPDEGSIHFIYPASFSRLKGFFKSFKEAKIKAYLNQIEKNIKLINKRDSLFFTDFNNDEGLYTLIDQEILKSDDSALQFSSFFKSLSYTTDKIKIINDLYNQFFEDYITKPVSSHITEDAIRKTFIKQIKSKSPELINKFQVDYIIKTENNEFQFDFAWQNGSFNLVKPVSFDLQETKKIQEKSILLYGNLSLLSDIAIINNYRFDLLVAKPQNKSIFSSFDRALKTIEKASVKKSIILQSEIESYAQNAFNYFC